MCMSNRFIISVTFWPGPFPPCACDICLAPSLNQEYRCQDGIKTQRPKLHKIWSFSDFLPSFAGKYHCWLQMDIQSLVMAWLIPIVILVILTFTVIEASSASEYRGAIQQTFGV